MNAALFSQSAYFTEFSEKNILGTAYGFSIDMADMKLCNIADKVKGLRILLVGWISCVQSPGDHPG